MEFGMGYVKHIDGPFNPLWHEHYKQEKWPSLPPSNL